MKPVTANEIIGRYHMKIVLTGGGTAGHVNPNIALLPYLQRDGFEVEYIGSYDGIEKKLIEPCGIPYTGISTGKLRRYFSLKNFTDPFRVIKGYREALSYLKKSKPDIVFSKGGFVSVPVVRAAGRLHIPCVIHEADFTPGLANKLCFRAAKKICCTFPETLKMLPGKKGVLTGIPIRAELLQGEASKGKALCGFTDDKPVLMVIGGSLGAQAVNEAVRKALPLLLPQFNIVHLCGKGKTESSFENMDGYVQFEYISEELRDLFAMTDVVVSRAGANAISELLALKKPNLLIPLPSSGSRGDQLLNANSFKNRGYSEVMDQSEVTSATLTKAVFDLYENRERYIAAMSEGAEKDAVSAVLEVILDTLGKVSGK